MTKIAAPEQKSHTLNSYTERPAKLKKSEHFTRRFLTKSFFSTSFLHLNTRNDLSVRCPFVIKPLKKNSFGLDLFLSKDVTLSPLQENEFYIHLHPLFAIIFPLMRMIETSTLCAE